jgi:membrane-associated phospholipid phosphatase
LDKPFSQKFARFISTLFVPPSFTIFIFIYFAVRFETDLSKKIVLLLVTLIFGFILHIALFLYFKKKGRLVDMDASIKEERTIPFLISAVFYLLGLCILIAFKINIISIAFWFCYISNVFIVVLINKFWKISVHSIGAFGSLASLFFAAGPVALLFFFIPLLVGWSRVKLKFHTLAQVTAGAVFGFCSVYLQMYLIIKWFGYAR